MELYFSIHEHDLVIREIEVLPNGCATGREVRLDVDPLPNDISAWINFIEGKHGKAS